MERKIRELFEKFLIDNNCYSQFIVNLLELRNISLEEYLDWNYCLEELINWSFTWSRTKEKHNYWSKIDSKWKEIVNKKL